MTNPIILGDSTEEPDNASGSLPVHIVPRSNAELQQQVSEEMSLAQHELDTIHSDLVQPIRTALMTSDADLNAIALELEGSIASDLQEVQSSLLKPILKVKDSAVADIQRVYSTWQDSGIQPPILLSDVAKELASPDPTLWVLERLGMGQCLFTDAQGHQSTGECPVPDPSAPPSESGLSKAPTEGPIAWSPPIVSQVPNVEWPPKSIFGEGSCVINTDPDNPGGAVNIGGVWYSPNGDPIPRREGCEVISGNQHGDYFTGRVPIPVGSLGIELWVDSCGWREYYLCWPVGTKVPTTPIPVPTTPGTGGTGCGTCAMPSGPISATITFGPPCSPGGGTGGTGSPPTTPPTTPPKAPPVPPTPAETPSNMSDLPAMTWDSPEACATLHDAMLAWTQHAIPEIIGAATWIGFQASGGESVGLPEWILSQVTDVESKVIKDLYKTFFNLITTGSNETISWLQGNGWPISGVTVSTVSALTLSGFISKWTGGPADYLMEPVSQAMRYSYPVAIPSQAELDGLYLTNRIDGNWWECLTRANGNLPGLHTKVRDSKAVRTNINEVIQLYYRGVISREELIVEGRKLGVTDEMQLYWMTILFQQLPTMSDIIGMMVKEADVPQSVLEDQLDDGFTESFGPQLQIWAKQNGIPIEVMKYNWRSHWKEVSPEQSYRMFQRLRPGRNARGVVFSREKLERYLKEDDYPPGILDALIEISYSPVTRTDAIKGYYSGTIDESELTERFRDVGYSPEDAELLVQILKDDRTRRTINQTGQWTPRKICKEYRQGSIDRFDAGGLLGQYYKDLDTIEKTLDNAELVRDAESKAICIKGVRRRYLLGEFDATAGVNELRAVGVGDEQIEPLLSRWNCEKMSRRKEPTVKYLQDWAVHGIINGVQFLERLINLGYSQADAQRIWTLTAMQEAERQAKLAKEAAKEAEAAKRRAAADKRQADKDRKAAEKEAAGG